MQWEWLQGLRIRRRYGKPILLSEEWHIQIKTASAIEKRFADDELSKPLSQETAKSNSEESLDLFSFGRLVMNQADARQAKSKDALSHALRFVI